MIVDLIRHDLHGVVGSGNVRVQKLMVVEEYATVFQLVTVIEGELQVDDGENRTPSPIPVPRETQRFSSTAAEPSRKPSHRNRIGLDVLAASLPPGSMTGAPKRRACQILQDLEPRPRGVYSGVLGYLDVGGGGDFSVVIRTAFRWEDDGDDCVATKEKAGDVAAPQGVDRETDTWGIGAGGAVTVLSSVESEWEEMGAKLGSTMAIFGE